MKKSNFFKRNLGILAIIYLVIILFITKFQYIYGSNVDFIRQHVIFPDYFRNLFYETGKILPEFALHLGAGENIFYYAYYGFLSPIILLSYFFPFIKMIDYLVISHILIIFISTVLLYLFLYKNKYNEKICFISSLLFLLSNSLIFHSHRHLMFVNYMPFLLLALIGVIRYFDQKKSALLITNIFLMILTSFYFSIPGIIVICLYALYYYLKNQQHIKIKDTIFTALKFLIPIFLGILLSSFFLLPIINIIMNGRNTSAFTFNISLLIPKVNLEYLMYGTYGIGLTSIMWLATIYNLMFSKKENRTLSILLLIIILFPIFNNLLNGGLYTNGKCFIPFLPLYSLLIADMIKSLNKKNIKWPLFLIITFISLLFINTSKNYLFFLILEIIITSICLYLFNKKNKYYLLSPIILIAFIICIITNQTDNLISVENYKIMQEINNYDYEELIDNNSIYRFIDKANGSNTINYSKAKNDYRTSSYSSTTNPYYTNTFYNTFNNNDIYRNKFMLDQTNNLFFQRFMGIKYLLTNKEVPYGYEKLKDYNKAALYKTENILPIGFATNHILNLKEYDNLSFNEQLEAFNNNIIINGPSNNANLNTLSQKIKLDYNIINQENLIFKNENNHYLINSQKNGYISLELNNSIKSDSLIIRFKMNNIPNCKNGDTAITINGITNKLTCKSWKYYNENEIFDYVISSNKEIKSLEIEFTKGYYDISEIEIYQIPNDYFKIIEDDISPLIINETYSKNNVKNTGYFIFTIPYDKGFVILVDGKNIDYELVNNAFIGFKIEKGNHKIELKFKAPLLNSGKIISISSLIIIIIFLKLEKKRIKLNSAIFKF